MTTEEFNKRCNDVFDSQEGDYYYSITISDNEVFINMEEIDENGDTIIFDYKPDMSGRPEALAYLLGQRDDFND